MSNIGYASLILAFLVAIFSTVVSVVSARTSSRRLNKVSRYCVVATAGLYTLALISIVFAFITKDFSLRIVSEHVNRDLPVAYALSALYADKTGSILLWGWLVSIFTAGLASRKHEYDKEILPYMLSILVVIQVFFLALVILVGNVFEKNPVLPADGFGLNPLLQNVAMLVHPPMLYISFAALSVVFALVMAALITRVPDADWIRWSRRWMLFAWCTLGLGNLIGMWWSYNELGWGGYWAWDPVENAGLMPWLLATAFIHSSLMLRQRNYLKVWSLVLIVFTFVFTLLIPFITHGGIESPLHGFYGSSFPPYLLAAILVTLVLSLGLLYFRQKGFQEERGPSSFISREGAFVLTNITLVVLVFVIFSGTVFPRVVESCGGFKIAIGRSFFDQAAGPIMLALVFFIGICPLLGWGKSSWNSLRRNSLYPFLAILIISIVALILGGNWYAVIVLVCGFPLAIILMEWFRGTRARHRTTGVSYIKAFFSLVWNKRARYGGFVVHIGIILVALGIIASSFYSIDKTATLEVGQSMQVGEYELTYDELMLKQSVESASAIAHVSINRNGRLINVMYPEYNYWFNYKEAFAEVAIRTTPADDLFVSLVWTGYDPMDKSATFRVLVNPLVIWIWVGGVFLLLGGIISFSQPVEKLPGARV